MSILSKDTDQAQAAEEAEEAEEHSRNKYQAHRYLFTCIVV